MVTSEEIARVRRFLWEREEKRRQIREQARYRVLARLKEALKVVAPFFPVERVYLYGSMLTGRWRPDSDLDLAVEGNLSGTDLFNLWAELDRRFEQDIDLREITRLPFKDKIKREGIVLYERKNPPSS
ncbi:nucleotidyltransferase domain-containing protein [Desulfofundulus thermobenzoicus]|uniref:Nucleotidyltransferase domain-containing protein n=1 Tax=Desulfofundulus thermobenzoicus TaxID=29376 RepID=A0A6N7IP59_9FIRM|nr:nucleotidyltransferase domain-containing protein [Desulfofundulus thermobenzoicus]MQL51379.1 nucleotidyltransferase domain-containing protein [Desulfofundulus thermobenzoicus]HHW43041.1 nucleotidyltransferase domain-containing protein [Desulfotomaculum sp.]